MLIIVCDLAESAGSVDHHSVKLSPIYLIVSLADCRFTEYILKQKKTQLLLSIYQSDNYQFYLLPA
jgi:hypothetical protein